MPENDYNQPESFKPSQETDNSSSLSSQVMENQRASRLQARDQSSPNTSSDHLPPVDIVFNSSETQFSTNAKEALDKENKAALEKAASLFHTDDTLPRGERSAAFKEVAAVFNKIKETGGLDAVNHAIEKLNADLKKSQSPYKFETNSTTGSAQPDSIALRQGDTLDAWTKFAKTNTEATLEKAASPFETTTPLSMTERSNAFRNVVAELGKIKETGGQDAVTKAVEKLNSDLAKSGSIYKFDTSQSDGIVLRGGGDATFRKFDQSKQPERLPQERPAQPEVKLVPKRDEVEHPERVTKFEPAKPGVAQSAEELGKSLDKALETKNFTKFNADMAASVVDAYNKGGMDAVRKLEAAVNENSEVPGGAPVVIEEGGKLKIYNAKPLTINEIMSTKPMISHPRLGSLLVIENGPLPIDIVNNKATLTPQEKTPLSRNKLDRVPAQNTSPAKLDSAIKNVLDNKTQINDLDVRKGLLLDLSDKLSKLSPEDAKKGVERLNQQLKEAGVKTEFRILDENRRRVIQMKSDGELGLGSKMLIGGERGKDTPGDTGNATTTENTDELPGLQINWVRNGPDSQGHETRDQNSPEQMTSELQNGLIELRKKILDALDHPSTGAENRKAAHKSLAETVRKLEDQHGPQKASDAITELNERLEGQNLPYRFGFDYQSGKEELVLKGTDGRIYDSHPVPEKLHPDGLKTELSQLVKEDQEALLLVEQQRDKTNTLKAGVLQMASNDAVRLVSVKTRDELNQVVKDLTRHIADTWGPAPNNPIAGIRGPQSYIRLVNKLLEAGASPYRIQHLTQSRSGGSGNFALLENGEVVKGFDYVNYKSGEVAKEGISLPNSRETAQIEGWIGKLADDEYSVRTRAHRELEKMGTKAVPQLHVALQEEPGQDLESRRRLKRLLDRVINADLIFEDDFERGFDHNFKDDRVEGGKRVFPLKIGSLEKYLKDETKRTERIKQIEEVLKMDSEAAIQLTKAQIDKIRNAKHLVGSRIHDAITGRVRLSDDLERRLDISKEQIKEGAVQLSNRQIEQIRDGSVVLADPTTQAELSGKIRIDKLLDPEVASKSILSKEQIIDMRRGKIAITPKNREALVEQLEQLRNIKETTGKNYLRLANVLLEKEYVTDAGGFRRSIDPPKEQIDKAKECILKTLSLARTIPGNSKFLKQSAVQTILHHDFDKDENLARNCKALGVDVTQARREQQEQVQRIWRAYRGE